MISTEVAVQQLDHLLGQYRDLANRARYDDLSDLGVLADVLVNRLMATIERLSLPGSTYIRQLDNYREHPGSFLTDIVAISIALRDDLQAGWLSSIVELVHADTYNDFLEMAEGLLSAGYKDAAAVIVGSSLEAHIRALCIKHGIDIEVGGKPKKADVMNVDLKKAGVYGTLEQKNITAWLDLRNSAAHGKYSEYDDAGVRRLTRDVRDFAIKYPA